MANSHHGAVLISPDFALGMAAERGSCMERHLNTSMR